MAAIEFQNVVKRYGKVDALRGVTFSVEKGEMFGLIGPDGAGKTTTIRLVCGLLRADAGTIRVLGFDPLRDHRKLTASVGYLSQRFSLYGDLSIDENIEFFARIHGVKDFAVRRTRLREHRKVSAAAAAVWSGLPSWGAR
jgi:ABC-2 type transport system ATP-binding protein